MTEATTEAKPAPIDIERYLEQHQNKALLRFLTCGSVDDGKSTLIGRLLHDSKTVYEDQLASVKADSRKRGAGEEIDFSLLVDGLQAEREQGITIDVAYRYFSTDKRKFIIADTPGHEQYTRNMATGASNCDVAVILIDARNGVLTQTRRHSYIVSLLGIRRVIVAINKMDLVGYDPAVFDRIRADYLAFADRLGFEAVHFVPLSALKGDNVVEPSARMPWYDGPTLLRLLETIEIDGAPVSAPLRFPVQFVNRPHADFRGFSGTVGSGRVAVGDPIRVLPSGTRSRVARIVTYDGDLPSAFAGQAVTLVLEDEIDVSRGDVIVRDEDPVGVTNHFKAHLVWMHEKVLETGREYLVKLACKTAPGRVTQIHHRIDVNTQALSEAETLGLNDIGVVDVVLNQHTVIDPYAEHRATGAFIVIDRLSNATVGAGMVIEPLAPSDADFVYAGRSAVESELHALLQRDLAPEAFETALRELVARHYPHWWD
ncbi:MAG: sulfate adenylyltransferase subunit 1 [Gammaproteobacteria bacterium]|nr:MAG: sulfate adenylyltransferase subunit 1 [Gammaproteobacteria bacterium]